MISNPINNALRPWTFPPATLNGGCTSTALSSGLRQISHEQASRVKAFGIPSSIILPPPYVNGTTGPARYGGQWTLDMSAETPNPAPLGTPDQARQRASSAASATAVPGQSSSDEYDKNTRQPPPRIEGPSTTASPAPHTFSHPPPPNGPHDKPSQLLQSQGFVAPSSYLRQRGDSRPMATPKEPETALDRDQQRGLVGARGMIGKVPVLTRASAPFATSCVCATATMSCP